MTQEFTLFPPPEEMSFWQLGIISILGGLGFIFLIFMCLTEYDKWDEARKARWRRMSGNGGVRRYDPTPVAWNDYSNVNSFFD